MTIHVLHVVSHLSCGAGASELAMLLARSSATDVQADICTLEVQGTTCQAIKKFASPRSLNRRHRVDPLALARLRELIHLRQPHVVHAWGLEAALYAAIAASGKRDLAVVGDIEERPDAPAWKRWLSLWLERKLASVVSRTPSNRWLTLPRGVEPSPAPEFQRKELLRNLGLPEDSRLIAVVSRLTPRKRVKELLWAVDLVRVLQDKVRLLVIGDGPQRQSLEKFAMTACEPDARRILFLGEREDLRQWLPCAEVYWHAGDERVAPMALLEAMAAGVPVVADATLGAAKTITHLETGLLVSPGARAERARATLQLFTDNDLASRLSAKAKEETHARYCADAMAKRFAEVYRSLGT